MFKNPVSSVGSLSTPFTHPHEVGCARTTQGPAKPGITARLTFVGTSSASADSARDYLLSSSPFASSDPAAADVLIHNPITSAAAAKLYSDDQALRCDEVLAEAMASGHGVFQFVSPAAHRRQPSRDIPIADYLMTRFLTGSTGPLNIGGCEVIGIGLKEDKDGVCKTYTVSYKHPTYGPQDMKITQVGISYQAQFFGAKQLAQIHQYYQAHQDVQRSSRNPVSDQSTGAQSVCAPTLVSYSGFGRNAALLSCVEGLEQIRKARGPLSDDDMSALVRRIREQGRETYDSRFLHNDKQFDAVVEFLSQQRDACMSAAIAQATPEYPLPSNDPPPFVETHSRLQLVSSNESDGLIEPASSGTSTPREGNPALQRALTRSLPRVPGQLDLLSAMNDKEVLGEAGDEVDDDRSVYNVEDDSSALEQRPKSPPPVGSPPNSTDGVTRAPRPEGPIHPLLAAAGVKSVPDSWW